MLIERYHTTVSPQEEMLVSLNPLPVDVNVQWIQHASVAVSGKYTILLGKHCLFEMPGHIMFEGSKVIVRWKDG